VLDLPARVRCNITKNAGLNYCCSGLYYSAFSIFRVPVFRGSVSSEPIRRSRRTQLTVQDKMDYMLRLEQSMSPITRKLKKLKLNLLGDVRSQIFTM